MSSRRHWKKRQAAIADSVTWWSGMPDLWTCRDCDWRGYKPWQHEQETSDEDGLRHWTICPASTTQEIS